MVCPQCGSECSSESSTCAACRTALVGKPSNEQLDQETESAIAAGLLMAVMFGGMVILTVINLPAVWLVGLFVLGVAAIGIGYRYGYRCAI